MNVSVIVKYPPCVKGSLFPSSGEVHVIRKVVNMKRLNVVVGRWTDTLHCAIHEKVLLCRDRTCSSMLDDTEC